MVLLAIHEFVQANGSEPGSDSEEALLHHVGRALQAQGGMVVVRRGLGARDMAKSASTLKNTFLVVRPAPGTHTSALKQTVWHDLSNPGILRAFAPAGLSVLVRPWQLRE